MDAQKERSLEYDCKDQAQEKTVYVSMVDNFLSGWGRAENKKNILVISCNGIKEAKIVARNARQRGEMSLIGLHLERPSYDEDKYLVSWHGREQDDYERWFEEGAFRREVY